MDFSSAKRFIPAILLAFAMSPAVAQQQKEADAARTGADGKAVLKRAVPPTHPEQLAEANVLIQGMKGAATNVSSVLWKARGANDSEKQLCANEKLSEANTAVNTAEGRFASLKASANDLGTSTHEFTMIRALAERSDQLVAESRQCIGEEGGSVGETITNSTVDPDIPADETLTGFVDGQGNSNVVNDIPRCTSCN